jgi:hypothetical protein
MTGAVVGATSRPSRRGSEFAGFDQCARAWLSSPAHPFAAPVLLLEFREQTADRRKPFTTSKTHLRAPTHRIIIWPLRHRLGCASRDAGD